MVSSGRVSLLCWVVLGTVATSTRAELLADEEPTSPRDRAAAIVAELAENRPDRILVIGLLDHGQSEFFATGQVSENVAADERTIFEIGSISKTFTGTALASMHREGTLRLDRTVGEFVPPPTKLDPSVAVITMEQLATHTSGLPRIARSRMAKAFFSVTPYGGSRETLDWDLSLLTVEPSEHPSYSNLGVGLLGDIMSRVEEKPFAEIVRERVAEPLGMNDTVVTLTGGQETRFAPGFIGRSRAKPWSDMGTAVSAGGLRSTAADLLIYAAAVIDAPDGPLGETLLDSIRPRVAYDDGERQVGLCWHSFRDESAEDDSMPSIVFHNGATYSHGAALFIDRAERRAVVVLLNALKDRKLPDPTGIGLKLIGRTE